MVMGAYVSLNQRFHDVLEKETKNMKVQKCQEYQSQWQSLLIIQFLRGGTIPESHRKYLAM